MDLVIEELESSISRIDYEIEDSLAAIEKYKKWIDRETARIAGLGRERGQFEHALLLLSRDAEERSELNG